MAANRVKPVYNKIHWSPSLRLCYMMIVCIWIYNGKIVNRVRMCCRIEKL